MEISYLQVERLTRPFFAIEKPIGASKVSLCPSGRVMS
jgi:hypothetical protein